MGEITEQGITFGRDYNIIFYGFIPTMIKGTGPAYFEGPAVGS